MDKLQPIPQDQIKEGHAWRDWLFHLREKVNASALVGNGVTKIVAGTNVTISPIAGLGDVTVNVSDSDTTGTVTLVSVITANGISGTVATNTTTPAITLVLGAISPSSVVSTGAVSGTNLSGTNTGDQILSQVTLINQIADIVDTAFSVNTVGLYRIEYYLLDTTSDVTAGTVTLNIKYTDDAVARTISSTPIVLSATTGFTQGTIVVRLNSGNVTYGITHTGIYGASKYAIYLTQERLI
jgi:hypothetical protein